MFAVWFSLSNLNITLKIDYDLFMYMYVIKSYCFFAGCLESCVSGFSNQGSIENFFNTNPNVNLVSYLGVYRVTPDLGFSCNTSITHINFGAKPILGNSTSQIKILRPLLNVGSFIEVHVIPLTNITSGSEPGVYRYKLPDPVSVQANDILSIYEPENSTLKIYTEKHSVYDGHSLANKTGSTQQMPLLGDDLPLITLDTSEEKLIINNFS